MAEPLRTTFTGVEFPNPFLLASAPPTRTADMMKRALEAGWGGVVTKTFGLQGAINVRPRFAFWKDDDRIMGMTNPISATGRSSPGLWKRPAPTPWN